MDTYSFESRVRYSECDQGGRLSLFSAINYLQDCSTFQSERVREGGEALAARGLAWVLAAWRVEFGRLPALGERILVSTWCYEMTRAHAMRCFSIEDSAGAMIVRADSQWAMYDSRRGRATRVPEDQLVYRSSTPRLEMGALDRRLSVYGDATPLEPVRVRPHCIDTNNHVNNAQYVLLALEALGGLSPIRERGCVSVLYREMAHLGDLMVPVAYRCEHGWDVDLTDGAGTSYAQVRFQGPEHEEVSA